VKNMFENRFISNEPQQNFNLFLFCWNPFSTLSPQNKIFFNYFNDSKKSGIIFRFYSQIKTLEYLGYRPLILELKMSSFQVYLVVKQIHPSNG
jgi:hypothetical protein